MEKSRESLRMPLVGPVTLGVISRTYPSKPAQSDF